MLRAFQSHFDDIKNELGAINTRLIKVEQRSQSSSRAQTPEKDTVKLQGPGPASVMFTRKLDAVDATSNDLYLSFEGQNQQSISAETAARRSQNVSEYRRGSLANEAMQMSSPHSIAEGSLSTPTVVSNQASYDHIKLTSLNVQAFEKFIELIRIYQFKYRIMLVIPPLISDRIRRILVNLIRYEMGKNISETEFYSYTLHDVEHTLKAYCRPSNKLEFIIVMKKSLTFNLPEGYKVEVTKYRRMYESLCEFRESYLRVYDFLADGSNVPACNNKEGGLVSVLTGKVPFKYIEGVLQHIGKYSFNNVRDMWQEIFAVVEEDNKLAKKTLQLHYRFLSMEPQHKFDVSKPLMEKPFKSLSHLEEPESNERDTNTQEDHNYLEELVEGLEGLQGNNDLAVVLPGTKSINPQACQRMLLYGNCEGKTNCKYSHSETDLKSYWVQMSKLLQSSKYKPSTPAAGQLRHMALADDSIMGAIMQSTLYNLQPLASVLRAAYKNGTIILTGKTRLEVSRVLFDTGAITSNYIDSKFVRRNEAVMAPFVKNCKLSVRLGDYKTIREIEAIANLEMEFIHRGVSYVIKDKFQVLDMHGSNDVIIGLPTIVHKLARLFQYMLEDAAADPQLNTVTQLDIDAAVDPWIAPLDEAPEESESYVPCAFSFALHFMTIDRAEAIVEYESQFQEHVSPEMRDETPIISLLKSEKSMTCFVPEDWTGINGVQPLQLDFKPDIPVAKPKVRPINPRLAAPAEQEMKRLCKYHFRKSTSPYASPLVIAPKATKPFIRFCGNYILINKYIIWKHQLIPTVKHQIERILRYNVFVDIDMVNAFHQIKLAEETSKTLSVVTPWGQFEPLFLPEGVTPASGILQELVSSIFDDFQEWMICIFDNLLILATDYQDAYKKFDMFLDRCVQRNVKLKFAKTWIGYKEVKFFGFLCRYNSYEIMPERVDGINKIPFPTTGKTMLSFLGMTLFCSRFIEKYVEYASPLYDMTKRSFNWDESTWAVDYRECFQRMKEAVRQVATLFYPDYNLVFVLESDWSKIGVSAKLTQVRPSLRNGVTEYDEELLGIISKKMSGAAQNWDAMKGEAFGVYYGVLGFSYYLRGKEFYIKTDHANLRYIEQSTVPIIVRWHQYLQSFKFLILAQEGKVGFVPDYFTRLSALLEHSTTRTLLGTEDDVSDDSDGELFDRQLLAFTEHKNEKKMLPPEHYLSLVHGGRSFHHGERRTWLSLNERFPGHNIPYSYVSEYVAKCSTCQKNRLGMTDNITPVVRHVKVEHSRKRICVDTLFITPADMHGNSVAHIVVNMFTRLIDGYPCKTNDAIGVASALFQYQCRYGIFDEWLCDPASNFTAEVVSHLSQWFGSRQLFALVDRHEANGVEGSNKIILGHVYSLCTDEGIKNKWSDVTVWPLVIYEANYWKSTETPYSALQLTFGTESEIYQKLPAEATLETHLHQYIELLDSNLKRLRVATKQYQERLILKRLSANPSAVNRYQPGDFVLFNQSKPHKPSKLAPRFAGPYQVIKHESNNVECRHVVGGFIKTFHVENLKIFHGDRDKAFKAALEDQNQSVITSFLYHRGDPEKRSSVQFKVAFEDGDVLWMPWSQELSQTTQYEDYCRSRASLYVLLFTLKEAQEFKRKKLKTPITVVSPGDTVYVDLRCYGDDWFHGLALPDHEQKSYVVEYEYTRWLNATHTKIEGHCRVFKETFPLDHYFVYAFGDRRAFDETKMILVDLDMITKYPSLLPSKS